MVIPTNPQLTYQELVERNEYLTKVNIGQAIYIEKLEDNEVELINTNLKLARENDILTEEMFTSPKLHTTEHVV